MIGAKTGNSALRYLPRGFTRSVAFGVKSDPLRGYDSIAKTMPALLYEDAV
jgi:hypothetical protein